MYIVAEHEWTDLAACIKRTAHHLRNKYGEFTHTADMNDDSVEFAVMMALSSALRCPVVVEKAGPPVGPEAT